MRTNVILIRLVFTAILVTSGYVLHPVSGQLLASTGILSEPLAAKIVSAVVAAIIAVAIIFFEVRIRRASFKTLIGAAVGSILGIIGAYLIGSLISKQGSGHPDVKTFVTLAITFFMAYVGMM